MMDNFVIKLVQSRLAGLEDQLRYLQQYLQELTQIKEKRITEAKEKMDLLMLEITSLRFFLESENVK